MGNANGTVGFVHVLTTSPTGTKAIDAEIFLTQKRRFVVILKSIFG
jgi:hypothetical protein